MIDCVINDGQLCIGAYLTTSRIYD